MMVVRSTCAVMTSTGNGGSSNDFNDDDDDEVKRKYVAELARRGCEV